MGNLKQELTNSELLNLYVKKWLNLDGFDNGKEYRLMEIEAKLTFADVKDGIDTMNKPPVTLSVKGEIPFEISAFMEMGN